MPPLNHAVDRSKTPWLIVTFHVPPYHNYNTHFKVIMGKRAAIPPGDQLTRSTCAGQRMLPAQEQHAG